MSFKQEKRTRRHNRIRARIKGDSKTPRLCVFKSLSHTYIQAIDDSKGKTIASVSDKGISNKSQKSGEKTYSAKTAVAFAMGKIIADKLKEKKIEKIVFDRAGYKYHGRVKALAEGAREGGLKF